MKAEIITIGDEILIGQIIDSNSAYISKELDGIGISVYQIIAIQDDKEHITKALIEATQRVDVVILTGGLGPTKDDVTKYTLCDFFTDQLVRDDGVLKHIEELFSKYKSAPLSELNKEQAMVPSKAQVLHNEFGTAPGLWMEKHGKVYVAMPGVPYEMRNLMEKLVIPKLQEKFERPFIYHKTILTKGMAESAIAEKLSHWEEELPAFLKFAYLPNLGSVRLRISGKGSDEMELKLAVERESEKVYQILGEIVAKEEEDDEIIVVQINKILGSKKMFLSAAESCTGGALAAAFTTNPGASACFKGGVVSYATCSKVEVLKVSQELIEEYSVVSGEVAEAMAAGVKKLFNTDYALATTGNAGPTKGESDAEVGTVFIALATPEKTFSKKFVFGNQRDQVVGSSVNQAFRIILEEILEG